MSHADLPEDLSQWPADAYGVLGISANDDQTTIKRAYTRLLKRFKPEKFPEQYQRLRAAYDEALKRLEWRARRLIIPAEFADAGFDTRAQDRGQPEPSQPSETTPARFTPHVARQAAPERDVGAAAWELAKSGDPQGAYVRLSGHIDAPLRPIHWKDYARLYWLGTIFPELDADASPRDWLSRGLASMNLDGHLLELYRREIDTDPDEAFHSRFERLLPRATPDQTGQLLEIRWLAAQRRCEPEVVLADLGQVRPQLVFDNELAWCRLIIAAIQRCALSQTVGLAPLQPYLRELNEATHVHGTLGRELDRLDVLLGLAEHWPAIIALRFVPGAWLDLIRECWYLPEEPLSLLTERVIAQIATSPEDSLERLDEIRLASADAARVLCQQIECYALDRGVEDRAPATLPKYWPSSISSAAFVNDRVLLRRELLRYSLQEALHPYAVVGIARQQGWSLGQNPEEIMEGVLNDDNLQIVYLAWRAFWS